MGSMNAGVLTVDNFASQDFDICLRNYFGRFVENCGDLRILSFSKVKLPNSIAEMCGDDESAPKP